MKPYYADDWLTVYAGDNRDVLKTLEPESVHCVITSPPYWGLRDYGTATWEGGDEGCDHKPQFQPRSERPNVTGAGIGKTGYAGQDPVYRDTCGKCGAIRQDSQLGLESTPEQYVENMVAVFREVRRVLRNDGTCWLNLGDSYAGGNGLGRNDADRNFTGGGGNHAGSGNPGRQGTHERQTGLKPKDLVGIPWRVAFALQADGWYLRSDIIWSKPNPMPESVTDRPTKSHEYLFLLAKSERYYFDADAVREGFDTPLHSPGNRVAKGVVQRNDFGTERMDATWGNPAGRNIRSVWTIATQPYPGAHFATFPPKLVEPCIKAGAPTLGVVLDPFAGSGTVGLVAQSLSRRAVLIDLNPEYIEQQLKRNAQTPLGLTA